MTELWFGTYGCSKYLLYTCVALSCLCSPQHLRKTSPVSKLEIRSQSFSKNKDLSKPLEPVLWAGPCPIMNWQSYGPWYLSLTYNNSIMMHGWLGVRGEGGLSGGPVQEDSDALQGALSLVFCAVSAHTLQAAGPPVFEGQI